MTPKQIEYCMENLVEDAVILDDFSSALVGINGNSVLVYSFTALVKHSMAIYGMDLEYAKEFVTHNVLPLGNDQNGFEILYDGLI